MPKSDYSKLAVLVADPSAHMCGLITSMLRHLKVPTVEEALTSGAALGLLQHRKFGVIMVDDALVPMDGVAFTSHLRKLEDWVNRDTPVIMMSTTPDAARIAAARDAGITEFLRKPFAATHIASRIDTIISAPRPFIASESYVGPDRRRRKVEHNGVERRGS